METEQPESIGKYKILSVIGRGGMGVVYRGKDLSMGRPVAIKTCTHLQDPKAVQRFRGEAEKMGMLQHANIVNVYHYDFDEQNGWPYIVMEYVEGEPVDQLILKEEHVSLFEKLRIMEQVCSALAYAHKHEVLHRDVKPANVILRPDGIAKLLDFGIAQQAKTGTDHGLTQLGGVVGTIPYMAPERLKSKPEYVNRTTFDGRSDIFSAGVMLFEVLAGRLPFLGKDFELADQLLNEAHPPLSEFLEQYPPALDDILSRALAKDPSNRYQFADEMGADLYAVIETLKAEHARGLIASARQLSAQGEYLAAQNELYRLLTTDPRNTNVRAMIKDLNQHLSDKLRAEQVEALQREAETASRDEDFDLATAMNLLKPFAGSTSYEQILATIQALPSRIASLPEILQMRQSAQDAWNQENAELESLGRAYAAIQNSSAAGTYESSELPKSELIDQMITLYQRRKDSGGQSPDRVN